MKRYLVALLFALMLCSSVVAKGAHGAHARSAGPKTVHVRTFTRKDGKTVKAYDRALPGGAVSASSASTQPRDSHGRFKRSTTAKHAFERDNPCPSTGRTSGACPGYVVDHVTPLKRGGADDPSNMQWETKAEAKAKDRSE